MSIRSYALNCFRTMFSMRSDELRLYKLSSRLCGGFDRVGKNTNRFSHSFTCMMINTSIKLLVISYYNVIGRLFLANTFIPIKNAIKQWDFKQTKYAHGVP